MMFTSEELATLIKTARKHISENPTDTVNVHIINALIEAILELEKHIDRWKDTADEWQDIARMCRQRIRELESK